MKCTIIMSRWHPLFYFTIEICYVFNFNNIPNMRPLAYDILVVKLQAKYFLKKNSIFVLKNTFELFYIRTNEFPSTTRSGMRLFWKFKSLKKQDKSTLLNYWIRVLFIYFLKNYHVDQHFFILKSRDATNRLNKYTKLMRIY